VWSYQTIQKDAEMNMNLDGLIRARFGVCAFVLALGWSISSPVYAAKWCEKLTLAEVSAAAKPVVSAVELPLGKDAGNCTYYTDATKRIPVAVTQIYGTKGRMYYKLFCETDKGDVKPGKPIKDLGDQACFRSDSALIVRKGEQLILISIGMMGAKPEVMIQLGKAAIARL
jgi:hypothetical protein